MSEELLGEENLPGSVSAQEPDRVTSTAARDAAAEDANAQDHCPRAGSSSSGGACNEGADLQALVAQLRAALQYTGPDRVLLERMRVALKFHGAARISKAIEKTARPGMKHFKFFDGLATFVGASGEGQSHRSRCCECGEMSTELCERLCPKCYEAFLEGLRMDMPGFEVVYGEWRADAKAGKLRVLYGSADDVVNHVTVHGDDLMIRQNGDGAAHKLEVKNVGFLRRTTRDEDRVAREGWDRKRRGFARDPEKTLKRP